ncbi:MAG: RNA chaperone Hfq [Deltaproteobacteria bacterium RBG_16_49_23]|nr:MAG: RNA chaperone Hfq [Deltaproteobacteria bacterium RBG_16_49_23]
MMKNQINAQDQFLNKVRRDRSPVVVELTAGRKLEGVIHSFDNFCLILRSKGDELIYKHAISSITTGEKIELFEEK